MVKRICTLVLAAQSALALNAQAAEDANSPQRRWSCEHCYLHEDDGYTWLSIPLPAIHLGMVGVGATPPTRLSQELTARFAPLRSKLKSETKGHPYWGFGMPTVSEGAGPLILLRLGGFTKRVLPENASQPAAPERSPYREEEAREVVSADLEEVEFIPQEWLSAWSDLNESLSEIVKICGTAPSPSKRKRLTQTIEKGSRALKAMMKAKVSDEVRARAARVDPDARIVAPFQHHTASLWGDLLRTAAARLRITPETPILPSVDKCPTRELLTTSKSPADFMARLKSACSEDALGDELIYSQILGYRDDEHPDNRARIGRQFNVWQIERLPQSDFEALREEIESQLKRYKAYTQPASEPGETTSQTVEQWGVEVRLANADLLASKLVLTGILVERVIGDRSAVGLEAGDLIVGYAGVHKYELFRPSTTLDQRLRTLRKSTKLEVIRGDQFITLTPGSK